ncbi:MAG: glycosyltransferase family 4 protein [Lachnospiraceae bacterium]|nr:glycosyltransferase family 4 protein [Lachnospiraceae bacterium]
MITVGYWDQTYAEQRLIVNEENRTRVTYAPIIRERDDPTCRLLSGQSANKQIWLSDRRKYFYHPLLKPKCSVIHDFNGVCKTSLPWFASYETMLPRILNMNLNRIDGKYWLRQNARLMAKENCKGLFPISKSAYEIEKAYIKHNAAEYYEAILKKTQVIHPPQKELVSEEDVMLKNRKIQDEIQFVFVGTGFFFKGGKEMVEALAKLRKEQNIHLTIVSNFLEVPQQEPQYTKEDYRQCRRLIHENRDWITVYNKLTNRQVLRICRQCHVGLLPSYGDTYGYVCLEFQACGMPVVTSDIRAFPEINNDDCGYMFHIDGHMSGKEKQENNRNELTKLFENILEHPFEIERKGINSLERIRKYHSPKAYGEFMYQQYKKALE